MTAGRVLSLMNAIKQLSFAPDRTGTLVTIFYENYDKLSVTVPTPPPGQPVTFDMFLAALEEKLFMPSGHLAGGIIYQLGRHWALAPR